MGSPPSIPAKAVGRAGYCLIEDREGSLLGGQGGRDRTSSRQRVHDVLRFRGCAVAEQRPPLMPTREGRTLVRSERKEVYIGAKRAAWGASPQLRYRKTLFTRLNGRKAELWIGRRGGLTHLRESGASFIAKTYTAADGLAQKQGVCGSSEQ